MELKSNRLNKSIFINIYILSLVLASCAMPSDESNMPNGDSLSDSMKISLDNLVITSVAVHDSIFSDFESDTIEIWITDDLDIQNINLNFYHSGLEINPDPNLIFDYSETVQYQIFDEYGQTKDYFITVKYAPWNQVLSSAPFLPRDGAGIIDFNEKMWLLGGWAPGFYAESTTNEVWSSVDGILWEQHPDPPWEGRHCFGAVVFQNKLWIIGGDNNRGYYQNDIWNSPDGANWDLVSESVPWAGRATHYVVVHNDKIWVMGGQTLFSDDGIETVYNDVWSSTDGVNWVCETTNAGWAPRGQIGGSISHNGRIWLIGGGTYADPRSYFNDVWTSEDGINWVLVTESAPWSGRQYHNILVHNGNILVLGGYNENMEHNDGGNLGDTWFSQDGVSWMQVHGPGWKNRHAGSAISFNGSLYMIAGSINGSSPVNDVWRFSEKYSFPTF